MTRRRRGSRGDVRETLRRESLDGRLPAGTRLLQQPLAKRFGVAQGVVRESLLELQGLGLVEAFEGPGLRVAPMDERRLVEAFQIREALEGLAARLCCRRASRQDLDELRETVDRIHALGRRRKFEEAAELDRRFHRRLVELSGNRLLARLLEQCRLFGTVKKMDTDVEVVRRAHARILDAVERDLPDEAERRSREHVRSALAALRQDGFDDGRLG